MSTDLALLDLSEAAERLAAGTVSSVALTEACLDRAAAWHASRNCFIRIDRDAAREAARATFGALGSDTGASIRLPAAFNGVVGLKPTYGRVSRHGAMPRSWSFDHVGPIARTARDCALLLQIIAGHDPNDATTSALPVPDYLSR